MPEVVFRTNVMATFNVLQAADVLDVGRIVIASSVSVLGFPFFAQPIAPVYVPIDEDHPLQPQDAYALSKVVGEELAAGFGRRGRMTVISLRFPWIHTPTTFREQIAPMQVDPAAGASNLWSYIDARDVAEAVRLALKADVHGHEAIFAAAEDTFMTVPSRELVSRYYPTATIREEMAEHASLLDTTRAERLLGFRAKLSWRSYGVDGGKG